LIAIISQAEAEHERAERDLVQADPEMVHRGERHRQHERNRHRDDEAAAQAEREEADQQHDHHRLGQRAHELADRTADRSRLVGHLVQVEADRQGGSNPGGGGFEIMPERDDVAAGTHRHGDSDRLDATEAHARLRRVDEAALDLGDVGKPEQATVAAADAEVADRLG